MPPSWPRKPDRNDPEFRRLEDRINFAFHVALFLASNSGLWFFDKIQNASRPWAIWVTGGWAVVLVIHGVYIFAIANYSQTPTDN